ncbi:MAG: flagellar biosynthetic protein FliO [Pseudomonadota bacterium]
MDAPLFAAPAASSAHSTGGGLAEVTLALIVIVALIAGLAWVMKRTRGFGGGAGVRDRIQILSDRSVGQKERCVLVRVGETDILVGIAPGSVRTLHVFPAGANTEAPPALPSSGIKTPNFKDLLMRSLGK